MITKQQVNDKYFDETDMFFLNDYEEAIIGVDLNTKRVSYSVTKLIEICMENGKSFDDAIVYVRYNIIAEYQDKCFFVDDIF